MKTVIATDEVFKSDAEPLTPAQVIFYMLDEATRRTDQNKDGEFGISANGTFWHLTVLEDRINQYIERLKEASS